MASPSIRGSCLRNLVKRNPSPLPRSQRRWARVHDVRFIATHRQPSSVLEKYQAKLNQKAKREGLSSVDELKEAYKDKISDLRRKAAAPPPMPGLQRPDRSVPWSNSLHPTSQSHSSRAPPPPTPSEPSTPRTTPGGIKPLSSYLDIEKTRSLPPKEVEAIWRLRHADDKTSLCACIPIATYNRIVETARQHPQFILPLPRPASDSELQLQQQQGSSSASSAPADIHFLQWHFPPPMGAREGVPPASTVLFTHLAEYKLRGEYAPPHTTITHHLDLAGEKGLVLLNGNVVQDRGVSVDEGRWLVMCLQRFYGGLDAEEGRDGHRGRRRKELVEKFGRGDAGFDLSELLQEAERLT